MPVIRVSLTLPYALGLPDGTYATAPPPSQETVTIEPAQLDELAPQTILSARFVHPNDLGLDQVERGRASDADRLLRRTNRLLRWYRAVRRRPDVAERTRAQASPFLFALESDGNPTGWTEPLNYEETGPAPSPFAAAELEALVRDGLASGDDPKVEMLFLLDAEGAIQQGRFREAVLFCWSTIDSVFNRQYDTLVDEALAGEWGDARDFFKGYDFGLRNKMSAGMRFVAGRSLFAEPKEFWQRLSESYRKRNDIIHRGENATEDEARVALFVANEVVRVMQEVMTARPGRGDAASDA